MPWYRRPEDEEPSDDGRGARGGRGRGRARGQARGRGRGRPPHEPVQHPYVMGPPGPYAAPPYYHNTPRMEEMLPHWQYVLRAQQESHRMPNLTMLGPQRFPTRRNSHAGPTPYFNYEAAVKRDHFNPGGIINSSLTAQQAHAMQGGLAQSPGFHHPLLSPATYGHYPNQIPTQQKGQQQRVDKRTARKGDSSKEKRASPVRKTHKSQKPPSTINNLVISQASNVQENRDPMHHIATSVSRPKAHKTLDETAAFLNHPQLGLQKNKISKSSEIVLPIHSTSNALLQTAIIARDSTQAAQLLSSHEQHQALSAIDPINVRHDRATSTELPDFRKYSELSVTIAEVEPPPAHQASIAKTGMSLQYQHLHTPPLAHQAPPSCAPAQPQSARLNGMPSPPPAHQSSTSNSIHQVHRRHIEEHSSSSPQARQLSTVNATADNIVTATHASYDYNHILRKAQLIYEPSTDTIAAENVLYRPEKDLLTKEQVVYQRNNIMFAKTEIVYKDVIASAEAVYESDKVTARETVIKRPAGAKEAATQHNVQSALKSMQHTAALYRQQAKIIEQTRTQALVEAEHRYRSDAFAQMIAEQKMRTQAFVEAEHRSQCEALAQMIAVEQTYTKALVEAEHRSRSEALAQMIAAEQTYTKALVEAEHRSRSDAFAQMIAEQNMRTQQAFVEAEHRSQCEALAQIIAVEQTYTQALVEAEHRSRSEALAQMIAAEKTCTNTLEAEYRSRNEAYAQIIATEQAYSKALVEAKQRSRSDAYAQTNTEQRSRTKAVVKTEHLSRSDAFPQMVAARQTRPQALVEVEHQAHFQSAVDAQIQHRHNRLRETKLHEESLQNSLNLHNSLSNEHEQDESSEASKDIEILRLLLHCNALNNSSVNNNSAIPSQSLRQTRKRKRSSTRASSAAQPPSPQPSTSGDLQASIALNWSLQSLPAGLQAAPNYLRGVTNTGNTSTTDASDGDDD